MTREKPCALISIEAFCDTLSIPCMASTHPLLSKVPGNEMAATECTESKAADGRIGAPVLEAKEPRASQAQRSGGSTRPESEGKRNQRALQARKQRGNGRGVQGEEQEEELQHSAAEEERACLQFTDDFIFPMANYSVNQLKRMKVQIPYVASFPGLPVQNTCTIPYVQSHTLFNAMSHFISS